MPEQSDFWSQLNTDCKAMGPAVGEVTGAAYGFGAEVVSKNPAFAVAVDHIIGDFVGDHWADVCDLPQNISNTFDEGHSSAIDSGASQSDSSGGSVSMDM
jgi:hypothetical protein